MDTSNCQEFLLALDNTRQLSTYRVIESKAGKSFDNLLVVVQVDGTKLRAVRERGFWDVRVATPECHGDDWLSVYVLSSYFDREREVAQTASLQSQIDFLDCNYFLVLDVVRPDKWHQHKDRLSEVARQLAEEFIQRASGRYKSKNT